MNVAYKNLEVFSRQLLPRILTQVCRDPGSKAYGSFDRNWWHYKIRDFPSIILQQGGYALFCAAQTLQMDDAEREGLINLAKGSARFWNKRAQKFRAFEEYYPWEMGYPPLAFSTLAVVKLVSEGIVDLDDVLPGLHLAADQLQSRFEARATNQQVAGTAALCWIRKITPQLIDEQKFADICIRMFACQHEEGWFMEYGGPDLGYLSVTMDCLWDGFNATGDERFKTAAAKALNFIAPFVALPIRATGMHNARNTDYIVPYGIAHFLQYPEQRTVAAQVLQKVISGLPSPDNFLYAIDDRYFCHYIGHSVFRTLSVLREFEIGEEEDLFVDCFFEGTGHWLRSETPSGCAALVSTKKGGIVSLGFGDSFVSDFGWVIQDNHREWVSHWWADFWSIDRLDNECRIHGYLTPHKENESTTFKHMVLRILSLLLGYRIIEWLKRLMIFKTYDSSQFPFRRTIRFEVEQVVVLDEFSAPDKADIRRASRSSKRHVASADNFNKEDLACTTTSILCKENRWRDGQSYRLLTVYKRAQT